MLVQDDFQTKASSVMKITSLGKFRALQQCSRPGGAFAILAADHRGNLRDALQQHSSEPVTDAILTDFKSTLIKTLSTTGSAVLLDPEYSVAQLIASNTVSGQRGLLLDRKNRLFRRSKCPRKLIFAHWGVAKAKRIGATGIKLLVHYHPDSPSASQIESLVSQAVEDCKQNEIPLFLEPIGYSLDQMQKKLTSPNGVLSSSKCQTFFCPRIDVLKSRISTGYRSEHG